MEKILANLHFLKICLSVLGLGVAGVAGKTAFSETTATANTAAEKLLKAKTPRKAQNMLSLDAALERLIQDNQRYMSEKSQPFDFSKDRAALVGGQNPYASILSYADARILPEQCFDEKRGDLFVTRVHVMTLPQICWPVWSTVQLCCSFR